jgi:hypothetical protein
MSASSTSSPNSIVAVEPLGGGSILSRPPLGSYAEVIQTGTAPDLGSMFHPFDVDAKATRETYEDEGLIYQEE